MHVDNLSASYTKKGGIDSRDLAYDGKDLFNAGHVPDPEATVEAYGLPRMAGLAAYDTVAMARTTPFPDFASPVEKVLWLAFCTAEHPPLTATNLPAVTALLQHTNLSAVAADYFQTSPRLLKSLRISVKGMQVPAPRDKSGLTFVRLPAPLAGGYVALEFEASSPTNVGPGLVIPQRVVVSSFMPDLWAKPPRTYLGTRIDVSVAAAGTAPEPVTPPELPGVANIVDARFTDRRGMSFHYEETNATWVARTAPDPVKSLEGKRRVPVVKGPARSSDRRGGLVWLVLAAFLAPGLFFVRDLLRKFRTKNNTPDRQ